MKIREEFVVLMFVYLFLNSVMFGAIFSRPVNGTFLMIGLACGAISQLIVLRILWLVKHK